MNDLPIHILDNYLRATNYIAAAQIYLRDNFMLERPLVATDIKERLLGHWGTCPGINFVYEHLNYLIMQHKSNMLFVLGPGHGYPALQANLFLEGTLQKYYPQATMNYDGLAYLCQQFSWPYGFASHTSPETPGAIHEGGELGYALATAYGAILDNPDLIAACLIGDGEAETAATATSWHINKYIDPVHNGVVLPILHLNGYKISGPTIFGRMTNSELKKLFFGYGYEPIIIEGRDIHRHMINGLSYAYAQITTIQQQYRTGNARGFARFPLLIVKTPKGWTGIKRLHGNKVEGNHYAHQVVVKNARTSNVELKALERWLRSYKFHELFNPTTGIHPDLTAIVPSASYAMGNNIHAYPGKIYQPLSLPSTASCEEAVAYPGYNGSSSMRRAGCYLQQLFALNKSKRNLRFFSPDEIYSNKLDAILTETPRAFTLPLKSWDEDLAPDGLVIEMLSEHVLQGMAQGYILTGRHALFATYEAFVEVVSSMADQYAKFVKVARTIDWRGTCSSFTYILTSSGWRQEHNGFSHQNPSFIGGLLEKHCDFIAAYFPPDGNSTIAVLEHCMQQTNSINIIVAGKTQEPRWLTVAQARVALQDGLMIWPFASDENPDIVFAALGDYMTKECLAAIDILRTLFARKIRMRFVNIMTLTGCSVQANVLRSPHRFADYFTAEKPVIFNYHGYPEVIQSLLYFQGDTHRFVVNGYCEEGSTTTPFDMHIRNGTSRYHLVQQAVKRLHDAGVISSERMKEIHETYAKKITEHGVYIRTHGVDPEEIASWQWPKP